MTLEEAINYIEACRNTHVEWSQWQRSDPNWRDHVSTEPESAGTPDFHERVTKEYNEVLEVMRRYL